MKRKRIFKRILLILLILLIAIQVIRPAKNKSEGKSPHDISTIYPVPDSIQDILKVACYDCHSNNTRYPWYSEIQPVGWWLGSHIKDGKKALNFSEFTTYRIRKQFHRMDDINEQLKEDEMPIGSYTIIHKDAVLTQPQKNALYNWTSAIKDSIRAHYPPDSLLKK